ncbi:MAG: tetratricopeptide repeat protein [Flavobacteriaceae bacterium]
MPPLVKSPGYFFGIAFFVLSLVGCSTQQNRLLNREWHALNTKYNVVYHGNLSFEEQWTLLQSGYRENFWERLPVERIQVDVPAGIKYAATEDGPFSQAEAKAVKAIRKHGMLVDGQERNRQMIESYLLLGKSRYYDQRFVPALETFRFIIQYYKATNALNETRIWKEKTNVRLGNPEVALENLRRLLANRKLKPQEKADAFGVMAQAYMDLNQPAAAVEALAAALKTTAKKVERGRYGYLRGQLFEELGQRDSALTAYRQVAAKKHAVSYDFWINAQLRSLALQRPEDLGDAAVEQLSLWAKRWENQEYRDKIFFYQAQIQKGLGRDSLYVYGLNQSLKWAQNDPVLQGIVQEQLAEHYFDRKHYLLAAAHLDTLLPLLPNPSDRWRAANSKKEKLQSLVEYLNRATELDSVLTLASLSAEEQRARLTAALERKKMLEEEKAARIQAQKTQEDPGGVKNTSDASGKKAPVFYFYDPKQLALGAEAFAQNWGNIAWQDNWRDQANASSSLLPSTGVTGNNTNTPKTKSNRSRMSVDAPDQPRDQQPGVDSAEPQESMDEIDQQIAQLPTNQQEIDALRHERVGVYFQIGQLYVSRLAEPALAIPALEKAVDYPQEHPSKLPALYALYQAHTSLKSQAAERYKEQIQAEYPQSVYAQYLAQPDRALTPATSLLDSQYAEVYALFTDQQYRAVIEQIDEVLEQSWSPEQVSPWVLLRAQAMGKTQGKEAFLQELERIVRDYPNTPAALSASVWSAADSGEPIFGDAEPYDHYKAAVLLPRLSKVQDSLLMDRLNKWLLSQNQETRLRISRDAYDQSRDFYVVHGYLDPKKANALIQEKIWAQKPLSQGKFFVFLASHYRKIQLYKALDAYQEQRSPKNP